MGAEELHHCGHVIRKKIKRGKVEETLCMRIGAEPMFTRSVLGPHTRPQPRWFCSVHWNRHEEVMYDGVPTKRPFPGQFIHRIKLKVVA
jgi:hypothetical protein